MLRRHRLLEVRPPEPGHVPRRRPHGGGGGLPTPHRVGDGRRRHEDLRPHGRHRQDRAGQLPGAGSHGQAGGCQAGAHRHRQAALRLPGGCDGEARRRRGGGLGCPPGLPRLRGAGPGHRAHRLGPDGRRGAHRHRQRHLARVRRAEPPGQPRLHGHLVLRPDPEHRHRRGHPGLCPAGRHLDRGAGAAHRERGDLCAGPSDQAVAPEPGQAEHQGDLPPPASAPVRRVRAQVPGPLSLARQFNTPGSAGRPRPKGSPPLLRLHGEQAAAPLPGEAQPPGGTAGRTGLGRGHADAPGAGRHHRRHGGRGTGRPCVLGRGAGQGRAGPARGAARRGTARAPLRRRQDHRGDAGPPAEVHHRAAGAPAREGRRLPGTRGDGGHPGASGRERAGVDGAGGRRAGGADPRGEAGRPPRRGGRDQGGRGE